MKYLLCKDLFNREKYYDLKPMDEQRIEKLFSMNPRPKSFLFHGTEILTDEVVGFTDDKPEEKKDYGTTGIRSMDDLRKWAETQRWYRHKSTAEVSSSETPEAITLLP